MSAGRGPLLITGGVGFIGANIADTYLAEGRDVIVLDSLARPGVENNLAWMRDRYGDRVLANLADIRDELAVRDAVGDAAEVIHLAAQVAVTTSLADPHHDFQVNAGGTVSLLEALRRKGARTPTIFASTNKVYGDLADLDLADVDGRYAPKDPEIRANGIGESRGLDFHTPYGCSKGVADQYVLDYARSFGLPAAVLRMSCIYGPRQFGTEDQGWVAHFLIRALAGETITLYGDGRQVRDILHVADAVAAYRLALAQIGSIAGKAFNLGGGPANAVSLRQVVTEIERLAHRRVSLSFAQWRRGDQLYFVADTRRLQTVLGWRARIPWREGLRSLADWLRSNARLERVAEAPEARRISA
jgi:CDP-paratose 2-epimerase